MHKIGQKSICLCQKKAVILHRFSLGYLGQQLKTTKNYYEESFLGQKLPKINPKLTRE
jgi:hypothetical protein